MLRNPLAEFPSFWRFERVLLGCSLDGGEGGGSIPVVNTLCINVYVRYYPHWSTFNHSNFSMMSYVHYNEDHIQIRTQTFITRLSIVKEKERDRIRGGESEREKQHKRSKTKKYIEQLVHTHVKFTARFAYVTDLPRSAL